MIWLGFGLLVVTAFFVVACAMDDGPFGPPIIYEFAVLVFGLAALGCFIGAGVRSWQVHHHPARCEQWGELTDHDVKFVVVSYADYDCYVRTDDGWVPRADIVKVERGDDR